jgi:hypothetical protein
MNWWREYGRPYLVLAVFCVAFGWVLSTYVHIQGLPR